MEQDQIFTEFIVKSLCNHPDHVRTERTVDERGVLLTLSVHDEDVPLIVGRQGYVATTIRKLLRLYGKKIGENISLRINQPEAYVKKQSERFMLRRERSDYEPSKNSQIL